MAIKINTSKTNVIVISDSREDIQIEIEIQSTRTEQERDFQYLAVTMERGLQDIKII